MPTLLHSISPFPSTGKSIPETSRTKPKTCFVSQLVKNPTLSLNKPVCAISATTHDAISPEFTTFDLSAWKNLKNVTKKKLLDAYQLLVEMAGKGNRPEWSQAKILIHNLLSHGWYRKAVRVMELMVRAGTLPDPVTCTVVIETLSRIGAYEYAIQLLDELEYRGCIFNQNAYHTLTMSLCRQAHAYPVWRHLEKLIQKGVAPSNPYVVAALVEAARLQGGADAAVSVLYQIMLRGHRPNLVCYNNILTAFKKENRASEALELFSVLPSYMRSSLITYNILLNILGDQGRWREVEALLDSMIERNICPNIISYKVLILVIAKNGYAEEALEIAEELLRNGFNADAWCFNPIIAQFCSERRLDMVHKCLEIMEKWRCPFNEGTYKAITILCKEEMVDEAFDILQSLRKKQGAMLSWFYGKVVLPYLCRKGSTFEAFQILGKLAESGYRPSSQTVSAFVNGLCMEGLHEEAMEMFEVMDMYSVRPDVSNYNSLVLGLCKAGRIDLAIMALEKMVLKGYKPNESTYLYILEGVGLQGRKDLVSELLRELCARGLVCQESMERISVKFCLDDVEF